MGAYARKAILECRDGIHNGVYRRLVVIDKQKVGNIWYVYQIVLSVADDVFLNHRGIYPRNLSLQHLVGPHLGIRALQVTHGKPLLYFMYHFKTTVLR